jgi:hypothetical protein
MNDTGTKLFTLRLAIILGICIMVIPKAALAQQPEYQGHIDWAANDSGHPNCIERYLAFPILQTCLAAGNRSCVTSIAIEAAYRHMDQAALYLMAEITQCHNSDARDALYGAGPQAVGDYLRTYNRPAWGPALDLALLIAQAGG